MALPEVFTLVLAPLELFARGGGGGSGGGGSGGGDLGIAALGYLPAYYVTTWFHKHVSRESGIGMGSLAGTAVTAPFFFISKGYMFVIGVGAVIGVYAGLHNWMARLFRGGKKMKQMVSAAGAKDGVWQEQALTNRVQQVFLNYQADWSASNITHIKSYTTPRYFEHVQLMLGALHVMGRRNIVGEPQLLEQVIAAVHDAEDNTQDAFTVMVQGQAADELIDTKANESLYIDNSTFTEYWNFVRSGDQWLLDGINQATAEISLIQAPLQTFAQENNMFYSLDWGWLLLPRRGRLFSKASFKHSDINNHVIGLWNGVIVQLYTYVPATHQRQVDNYLVAQIALPKSYGGIIIQRKRWQLFGWLSGVPKGYQKVTFEWPDFNDRYVVYATDYDRLTSFELLNPAFMADLYDKNLDVAIEVADNVVYLHSRLKNAETRYADMLDVLKQAFRELKL